MIRLKREAKLKGGFYVDPEAKLLFIVRIRGYVFLCLFASASLEILEYSGWSDYVIVFFQY